MTPETPDVGLEIEVLHDLMVEKFGGYTIHTCEREADGGAPGAVCLHVAHDDAGHRGATLREAYEAALFGDEPDAALSRKLAADELFRAGDRLVEKLRVAVGGDVRRQAREVSRRMAFGERRVEVTGPFGTKTVFERPAWRQLRTRLKYERAAARIRRQVRAGEWED